MEKIVSVCGTEDEAYGQVNLVELINKAAKVESKVMYEPTASKYDPMKRRINDFKVARLIICPGIVMQSE